MFSRRVTSTILISGASVVSTTLGLPTPTSAEELKPQHRGAKGALYLTAGPSGAGKDTLLLAARQSLASGAEDHGENIEFLKRVITRDPSKCTDLEIPVSLEDFKKAEARGEFALSWHAHDTHYAIPQASLEGGLAAGKRLVANVSRTTIQTCLDRYGVNGGNGVNGHEVYCLLITASEAALAARLQGRGRESSNAEVLSRVERAKAMEPKGAHVIKVNNMGTVGQGRDTVLRALRGNLRYALWLVPSSPPPPLPLPPTCTDDKLKAGHFKTSNSNDNHDGSGDNLAPSPSSLTSSSELEKLITAFGTIDPVHTEVVPHCTLGRSFCASQAQALAAGSAAAKAVAAVVKGAAPNANSREGTGGGGGTGTGNAATVVGDGAPGGSGGGGGGGGGGLRLSFAGVGFDEGSVFRSLVLEVDAACSEGLLAAHFAATQVLLNSEKHEAAAAATAAPASTESNGSSQNERNERGPNGTSASSLTPFVVCPPAPLPSTHWASVLQRRSRQQAAQQQQQQQQQRVKFEENSDGNDIKDSGRSSSSSSSNNDEESSSSSSSPPSLFLDSYAPHVSLSYGSPLPAHAFSRAAQTFRTFPSRSSSSEEEDGGGSSGLGSSSGLGEGEGKRYVLGRALEFGSIECGALALVCCEGSDWRCWSEVARFDVTAAGGGKKIVRSK